MTSSCFRVTGTSPFILIEEQNTLTEPLSTERMTGGRPSAEQALVLMATPASQLWSCGGGAVVMYKLKYVNVRSNT